MGNSLTDCLIHTVVRGAHSGGRLLDPYGCQGCIQRGGRLLDPYGCQGCIQRGADCLIHTVVRVAYSGGQIA